jgi:hypothetical protein
MSGPGEPQYPYEPYPPQQPGPYPPAGTSNRLIERFAGRLVARPVPRLGVSLAGVGVGLAILGVLVWSITYIAEGSSALFGGGGSPGGSRHYLGAIISLVVVAVGYALAIIARRGPLATAGVTASALGVPVCVEFLTLDLGGGSTQLVNFDATVWISVAAWLVSYLFVRGTRGHSVYLGFVALVVWDYIVDKVAPIPLTQAVQSRLPTAGSVLNGLGPGFDLTTLGAVSLVIGAVYYAIALGLDRSGRAGAATPIALVAFLAVVLGIAALTPDLDQAGTGVVVLIAGLVLGAYGARFGRRFTTWAWAAGAALGAALLVAKAVSNTGGADLGVALICAGAAFVAGGALLAKAFGEPDDALEVSGPNAG